MTMAEDTDLNHLYSLCQTSLDGVNTYQLRWHRYVEKMKKGRIPKQIVTARMEGRDRRGELQEV